VLAEPPDAIGDAGQWLNRGQHRQAGTQRRGFKRELPAGQLRRSQSRVIHRDGGLSTVTVDRLIPGLEACRASLLRLLTELKA
jgi:hypothetical protein